MPAAKISDAEMRQAVTAFVQRNATDAATIVPPRPLIAAATAYRASDCVQNR
jgi:hypothetical protein